MRKYSFALSLFILVACGSTKTKKEENAVVDKDNVEIVDATIKTDKEIPQQRAVYHAARTIKTDLIHTKLEVNFNWEKSQMNGIATITAKPHFYASDSLYLDAKGMEIQKVQINNKDLSYSYDSLVLAIKLDKQYTRNDNYTIVINYIAKPDDRETGGSAAITSDKGLYFINPRGEEKGKMPQIWTQGETEASSVWFPTIDSPNSKTTQEIFITVADKYTTLSNGKLISSKKNTNGTRTDHWKQDLPHSPYLFMMGVGEFKVVKDVYTRADGSKMDVHYYVEPEWEMYARDIFGETPAMIDYFSKLLDVPYPWDKYHQIVVRDYVSGAMENTGAVVFGDYVYKTKRELLDENDQSTIAHELFHHWFGDLVTAESWSNLPLNESFANYSQYLWDEFRYGKDEADYQAEIEADGYYQSAQMRGYHDLIWFDYDDKEQMFDGHSYNKGGRILHMLRSYLGDEAFFKGMSEYLKKNKFKPAEFHQLRIAFEEVCGEDLNWFFNQWFLGSGHPILDIKQKVNSEKNTVTLTIQQKQNLELSPIFKLPIQIAVYDSNGKHIHKAVVDQLTQSVELPFNGTLKSVVFDDQQMLLAKIREDKPSEQYVFQFYNSTKYRTRKEGLMLGSKLKDQRGQQLILDALNDPFWHMRLLAIEKAVKLNEENKNKGNALIKGLAMNDKNSQVRAAAINFLFGTLPADQLEVVCNDRIKKDSSYLVVSTALKNLGKTNPDQAMLMAKDLEKESSSKMITGVAQLYGAFGTKDNFGFFESALLGNQLQGFDQLGVMNSMTYYLSRQEIDQLEKALPVYQYLKEDGAFYTQMFLGQNINYLLSLFDDSVLKLKEEIEIHEKNKDVAYADQARKKMKRFEELRKKYAALAVKEEQ